MNDKRRRAIRQLAEKVSEIKSQLEELHSEEEDAFENLPESLQLSDKGEAMEDAMNGLDTAIGTADMLADEVLEAIGESQ